MKQRCTNPKVPCYKHYGGRGIGLCEAWQSFKRFLEGIAEIGPRPSPKHSVDRIDNDSNYEPGNIRWATRKEQLRNQRRNVFLTVDGTTRCVSEWAEITGIAACTIRCRLKSGWDHKRAVAEPARTPNRIGSRP